MGLRAYKMCPKKCATLAQDPYLTGRLAAAFVRGLQGNDSTYIKVRLSLGTAPHLLHCSKFST